jgi:large subunit ribosomal protein L31
MKLYPNSLLQHKQTDGRESSTIKDMKKDIHPEYKEVVFHDLSADYKFLTR